MSEIAAFNELDRRLGTLVQLLNREYRGKVTRAAMLAGSIDAMPEPYKSWLSASSMSEIPNEALLDRFVHDEQEPPA